MTWIQTFTSRQFRPLWPSAADVCIKDIAHALSLKCRFAGHCREFYSVAQHSVIVSRNLPPEDALWGLMHDAAEAYLPDICRPIKHACHFDVDGFLKTFDEVEWAVLRAIAAAFGLPACIPAVVRDIDTRVLQTEARDIMGPKPEPWAIDGIVEPLPQRIKPEYPRLAERNFLRCWHELRGGA